MPYCFTSLASARDCYYRDLAVRTYQEAMVEGDVSPRDEAKAMWARIKEKSLALKQKLGKLTAIANPEIGDQSLTQVIIILSFLFKWFLE
jgi:hypothetical protein